MAFIFADSFETITATSSMTDRGWTLSGTPILETVIFKDGTQCVSIEANENIQQNTGAGANKIVFASFWFYKDHEDQAIFFRFRGGGSGELNLRVETDDTVDIIDQASTNLGSSAAVLTSDVWHHIEFKGVFKNSIAANDVQLKIDGILEITVTTATDTQFSTDDTITKIELESDNEVAKKNFFDSFIMWDEVAGDDWNDFRGQLRIETKAADANGPDTGFNGSDGNSINNYLQSDEINDLHDSDTTYNEHGAAGTKDSYNFPNMVATDIGSIVGVQVAMVSKKTDTGAADLTPFFVDGGTDKLGTEHVLTNGTYTFGSHLWDENPESVAAWTESDITTGNFGLKVT